MKTVVTDRLREGLRLRRMPPPCAVVIFGATGDLARRRLIPALYNLARKGQLPGAFAVIGVGRRPVGTELLREQMREAVQQSSEVVYDPGVWETFQEGLYYVQSEFDDPEGYARLAALLNDLDARMGLGGNRLFYLSAPPTVYHTVIDRLGDLFGRHRRDRGWVRIIIEKPFGNDLESARALNQKVAEVFDESEVFRIDHYLGKETVQNLMIFRFANTIFEPIWTRQYVDHIQITVAESGGIEGRGGYYDEAGVVRDMLQNHLLQLLTLTAMEPPVAFEADPVRDEKVKVLHAIRRLRPEEVDRYAVLGQYGPGAVDGQPVPGYRQEEKVDPSSRTPTFVAARFEVENWRWSGVPFFLRTGKRLPKRVTEIAIQFRRPPLMLFRPVGVEDLEPNVLALNIQPNEGISLRFAAKVPGQITRIRRVAMDFSYGASFAIEEPTAYERLLLDAMLGDRTLFARRDEVELAWEIVMPILEAWEKAGPPDFPNYEAGTWGPPEAKRIIEGRGRRWRRL